MQYNHQFAVNASQRMVADFHRHSDSMAAITPPPIRVQVHTAPELLSEGDVMDFTLWLGPLPIHWVARIEQTTPISFVDRLVAGPFARWEHLHTYVAAPAGATQVIDQVTVELSQHPFWRLVGLAMWAGMPGLFAYRGWRTKQILEAKAQLVAPAA